MINTLKTYASRFVNLGLDLFLLLPGIGLLIHQLRYFLILNPLLANLMRNCNSAQPDINTVLLTNIVDIYNLHQLIQSPTRITDTFSTLIDVTFTNCQNNTVSAGVSYVSLMDHSLVYAFRKISINSLKGHPTLTYRKFNNFDSARFRCDISTQDWDRVNSHALIRTPHCVQNAFGRRCHCLRFLKETKRRLELKTTDCSTV